MGQLGTSCVFDSPGLARNEPTPGKRLQGDEGVSKWTHPLFYSSFTLSTT